MITITIDRAQDHYNRLIALSDIAFKQKEQLSIDAFKYGWDQKAEAYHNAAEMFMNLCAMCGLKLSFQQTKWFEYHDQLRREGAEEDKYEMAVYEEVH